MTYDNEKLQRKVPESCNFNINDIVGKVYGNFEVLEYYGYIDYNGAKHYYYNCKCLLCNSNTLKERSSIINNSYISCGCNQKKIVREIMYKKEIHTPEMERLTRIYNNMKRRCYNKNDDAYPNYGGRGICVCDEWLGDNGLSNFRNWAINNGYHNGLTIDRINNNGNYEPSNCQWITRRDQSFNRRSNTYISYGSNGIIYTLPITVWAKILHIDRRVIQNRLVKYKWNVTDTINTPLNGKCGKDFIQFPLNIGPYIQYNRPDKFSESIHD